MVWFWLIRLRNFTDTQGYSAKAVEKEGVLFCISKGLFCFFNPFFFLFFEHLFYTRPPHLWFSLVMQSNATTPEARTSCGQGWRSGSPWRQCRGRWVAGPWILAARLIVMWPWPLFNDSELSFLLGFSEDHMDHMAGARGGLGAAPGPTEAPCRAVLPGGPAGPPPPPRCRPRPPFEARCRDARKKVCDFPQSIYNLIG